MAMHNYFRLIHQLLPEVEQFLDARKGEKDVTLEEFTQWLSKKVLAQQRPQHVVAGEKEAGPETASFQGNINMQITLLLINLARHLKSHSRKILGGIGLVSLDDFQFLLLLSTAESMTKSELINANAMEFSSGIEVIKRLLKRGLAEEYEDPDDGRSKRVKITQKGREKFARSTEKLKGVSELFPGSLPDNLKIKLLSLLVQLHDLHTGVLKSHHPPSP